MPNKGMNEAAKCMGSTFEKLSNIGSDKGSNKKGCKKVNFRPLINEERVENHDIVLPKFVIENVTNKETIMLDAVTISMCEDPWGRINFSRALVEISVDSLMKQEAKTKFYRPKEPGYSKVNSSKQNNRFDVLNTLDGEEESGNKSSSSRIDMVRNLMKSCLLRRDLQDIFTRLVMDNIWKMMSWIIMMDTRLRHDIMMLLRRWSRLTILLSFEPGNTSDFNTDNLFPTTLNESEALNMVRDISSQEVKSAMFSMGNDKSAGPDGFTAAFFKDTWDIIGVDVIKAVKEPISCCNMLFKCIRKIIANRLKGSLKRLTSNTNGKILPRRYTTYQEPLKDAGSSKSNISNVKDKVDTIRKPSFASVVHEKPQKMIIKNEVSVNGAAVTIPMEAVESVNARFVNTLYGYFIGDSVLENGPWLIRRVPLLLNEWTANTILKKEEIKRVPVWVKMHHVPIVAYSDVGVSLISTQMGKPLMLDLYNSNMCLNSWGRSAYARVLIEIAADVELVKSLIIAIPMGNKEGHTFATIDIEYEWTPPRCVSYCIFDHVSEKCPKLPKLASNEKVIEEGFIEVKKKKTKTKKKSKKQVE
nr:hypothetical protein [Tanacetum cinerariifolium]